MMQKKSQNYRKVSSLFQSRIWLLAFFAWVMFWGAYRFEGKKAALFSEVQLFEKMKGECTREEVRMLKGEIKAFPVKQKRETVYENGYGDGRSYGGKRKHEGIDIIPKRQTAGAYQVISATDGVVEKVGWLELGGYRVGIRSPNGFYYYYAHLDQYRKGLKEGNQVKAGDVLGNMGNTGYGKEGTKGKFIVHLHFGVYRQVHGKEKSLNPYELLRSL